MRINQLINESSTTPINKYRNALYKAKTKSALQKAWAKCLNNTDGLESWDIAELRSIHDQIAKQL
jgi:hypothetical protein